MMLPNLLILRKLSEVRGDMTILQLLEEFAVCFLFICFVVFLVGCMP